MCYIEFGEKTPTSSRLPLWLIVQLFSRFVITGVVQEEKLRRKNKTSRQRVAAILVRKSKQFC